MSERPTQEQLIEIVEPFQRGDLEAALSKAKELDNAFPDFPITQNLTGLILKEMGRLEEALAPLRAAVKQRPDYAEAQNNLGIVLSDLGRFKDAAKHYLAAIDQKPDYVEALNNLGCLMKDMDRNADALTLFDRAIAIAPDYVEAVCNKGDVLMHLGDREAAATCFRRSLELNPGFVVAHQNLAECRRYTAGDPHIKEMEALLSAGGLEAEAEMRLNFALGKAYDDIGEYDRAFKHFDAANHARGAVTPYDATADQKLFKRIKGIFAESVPELSVPVARRRPIFVLGMPRSGTSLTEQILASHSKVYGAGELGLLNNVLGRTNALNQPMSEALLREIRAGYLGGLADADTDASVITDKLPLNFRWIGFILKALPEAKVIHCARDARAVCWSIYRHSFVTPGNDYRYSLENIAQFYHLYQDLMAFWHERFPGRILDMDYELLTENQERETRRILDFAGLEWEDNCLSFHKTKRAVQTASTGQVRQEMYQGSSEAWRNYEAHLTPLLAGLGVRPEQP
ncbi:Tetratricopeptide repeat-containing protein [Litoreibacter ascidiaceicola]|uniref:Tetratricopeptide repeat-containing protein n=1 Tax=Litoreibacter ascidiaceicola TaxID=1486859 RepID=A0A1M4ZLD7_9RHOB|nr:sulfotransferase [Litoreibacter ascidiaceicola]SHF18788.1 Tetratricopeptide repeat-containing protein [Litoreibacter ascidiaceicola]